MKLIFIILLTNFTPFIFAAPIPGTSSSEFLKVNEGLFNSPEGFSIHSGKTTWIHTEPPKGQKYIATMYKAPRLNKGIQPLLTVRVDKMKVKKTLNQYMRSWIKVYPRLGFNVLSTKKVKINSNSGFLVDLIHPKTKRQIRQIVFVKKAKAVVLTCRDHSSTFALTLKSCNQFIRNFNWLENFRYSKRKSTSQTNRARLRKKSLNKTKNF